MYLLLPPPSPESRTTRAGGCGPPGRCLLRPPAECARSAHTPPSCTFTRGCCRVGGCLLIAVCMCARGCCRVGTGWPWLHCLHRPGGVIVAGKPECWGFAESLYRNGCRQLLRLGRHVRLLQACGQPSASPNPLLEGRGVWAHTQTASPNCCHTSSLPQPTFHILPRIPALPPPAGYRTNAAFTNHAIVSFFRRIAEPRQLNLEPMLYQVGALLWLIVPVASGLVANVIPSQPSLESTLYRVRPVHWDGCEAAVPLRHLNAPRGIGCSDFPERPLDHPSDTLPLAAVSAAPV